jgi:hypothetical protein
MTAAIVHGPPEVRRWGRGLITATLVAGCIGGVVLAVDMLRGNNPLVSSSAGAGETEIHVIGDDVSTSFGVVAVEHATAISGLNDQAVTGAHGIPGLVKEGTIDVQVAAVITNLSDNLLSYEPTQFELLDKNGTVVPLERAPQLPNELQPNAAIDVLLDFVATTDVRPFTVRFVDRATNVPVLISLGAVGCEVQGGSGRPLPVTGGCADVPKDQHTHG